MPVDSRGAKCRDFTTLVCHPEVVGEAASSRRRGVPVRFGRGAALLAAAMMAGGLAGCGGGDEPTEPSTTVSPRTPVGQGKTSDASQGETSGSESSGESSSGESTEENSSSNSGEGGGSSDSSVGAGELPEGMPAAATKRTEEGAAAFGKYYYDQFGEAAKTGDVQVISRLGGEDCEICAASVKKINKDAKKGWVRSENPYTISRVEATKRPDRGYKVAMHVDVREHHRIDSKGDPNGKVSAVAYTLTEQVVWREGRWVIADWIVS